MSSALDPLWSKAFHAGEARDANRLLTEARAIFRPPGVEATSVFSFEEVVPEAAEPAWLEEKLLPRLIYHCESSRAPLPACGGVFVSAFVGEKLFCVAASEVIAFAEKLLSQGWQSMVERHGTGELREAIRSEDGSPARDQASVRLDPEQD